ncbi:MAG: CRISPR system precrRNA processing endoribonuclease RAMP protein Cas6, partial [Terriglobia bacterium]
MQIEEVLSNFPYLLLRLAFRPQETLRLPAQNKGNTLRGAFGSSFRRLVCVPECRSAQACPLSESCPYKLIFEPAPPQGSDRLSKNQDIPRPFIFRPPLDSKTT